MGAVTIGGDNKYIKIVIELDTIYIREEMYGIILDEEKLNNIIRSNYIRFYQFFLDKYRQYPIILKNDNKYLTIMKTLLQGSGPTKAGITKLPGDYIRIDMSRLIDDKGLELLENSRVIPDVNTLFKNL